MASADPIEVLRAFIEAHDVPYPHSDGREPILVIRTSAGGVLKHHALGEDPPDTDDTLLQELEGRGWITVDRSGNAWKVVPTVAARVRVDQYDRVMNPKPVADLEPLLSAIAEQAESEAKLNWTAVRPVLLALRNYWEAGGLSPHGIQLRAVFDELREGQQAIFAATVRQLIDANYLGATTDLDVRHVPAEVQLSERTHAVLDGWPGAAPEDLVENLLAVLAAAAASESDPTRKRRLERIAETVREVGVSTAGEVLAKVFMGV